MHVLITNTFLANRTGSELYVRDVALELMRRGHEVTLYSPRLGALADYLRFKGSAISDDLQKLERAPDLIHGQHHLETMAALARFPETPAVYFCHGWAPWEETPPVHPRILHYVGVSERIRSQLLEQHGIPDARVQVLPNFVDLQRFLPRRPLPARPSRALAFSNQISRLNVAGLLRSACMRQGIRLDIAGMANGNPADLPEDLLPRYDLVLARGRCALEAMACGNAVICCDLEGLGPMVTPGNFAELRRANFGAEILRTPLTVEALTAALRTYDPLSALEVHQLARQTLDLRASVDHILEVYRKVLDEWATSPMDDPMRELSAVTRYVDFLSRTYGKPGAPAPPAQGKRRETRWRRRWRTGTDLVHFVLQRLRRRRAGGTGGHSMEPQEGIQEDHATDSDTPALACVVLSLSNQPTLVEAVRSVLAQDVPVEVVVVNSGGGDPSATLASAGLDVRVLTQATRLYPGGARNVGILATRAPFVSFLAADCLAEPGWAAGRIKRHLAGAAAVASAVTHTNPGNLWACAAHALLYPFRMPGTPPELALPYGVSYDRRLFDRYGLFREDLRTGEDTEFNARFSGFIPTTWAPEVRSAHFHPATLASLVTDQYVRGARMIRTLKQLQGRSRRAIVARNALGRLPRSLLAAWSATPVSERPRLFLALLATPVASLAYALGAVTAPSRRTPSKPPKGAPRILALLAFHNERTHLPGYFWNVAPQVDGILALDDGSTDGSGEFAQQQPSVLELIRLPAREPHVWDEPRNRRLLVQAAWRHGADWLVVVDADERLERGFRQRASDAVKRAEQDGVFALRMTCRELWDDPGCFRSDGIWGGKHPVRLFKVRRDHAFDDSPLHGFWAPLNSQVRGDYVRSDLIFYHLAMLTPERREARRAKYARLDPQRQHQTIGYDYLTDLSGLELTRIEAGREYTPLASHDGATPPVKLFALLSFHNEMDYLEGYFENLRGQVDGVIALDDGSTDGSGDFVRAQPSVIELIHLPPRSPHVWNEYTNHRMIIEAALRRGADWLIALDADERLERNFRPRALAEIARGELLGVHAYGVHFRELWDAPDRWRADGIWGRKTQARFFKARPDHAFDERPNHCHWAPLNSRKEGGFPIADLIIYHLRMIHSEARKQRQARYLRLDPENRCQPMGYTYLTEEEGLRLEPLPAGREYEPMPG